jgi:hypothetical protein
VYPYTVIKNVATLPSAPVFGELADHLGDCPQCYGASGPQHADPGSDDTAGLCPDGAAVVTAFRWDVAAMAQTAAWN